MEKNRGFQIPRVLLPAENVNLVKWACVACDQFTSQPDYWKTVEKYVGNAPSTLHITLPEVYLESENVHDHIADMKETMRAYLEDGILTELPEGVVLTERHINGKVRKGILLARTWSNTITGSKTSLFCGRRRKPFYRASLPAWKYGGARRWSCRTSCC